MSVPSVDRSLKVCQTCSYWSASPKGFCARTRHGVGRFWYCADWADSSPAEAAEAPPAASAPVSAPKEA